MSSKLFPYVLKQALLFSEGQDLKSKEDFKQQIKTNLNSKASLEVKKLLMQQLKCELQERRQLEKIRARAKPPTITKNQRTKVFHIQGQSGQNLINGQFSQIQKIQTADKKLQYNPGQDFSFTLKEAQKDNYVVQQVQALICQASVKMKKIQTHSQNMMTECRLVDKERKKLKTQINSEYLAAKNQILEASNQQLFQVVSSQCPRENPLKSTVNLKDQKENAKRQLRLKFEQKMIESIQKLKRVKASNETLLVQVFQLSTLQCVANAFIADFLLPKISGKIPEMVSNMLSVKPNYSLASEKLLSLFKINIHRPFAKEQSNQKQLSDLQSSFESSDKSVYSDGVQSKELLIVNPNSASRRSDQCRNDLSQSESLIDRLEAEEVKSINECIRMDYDVVSSRCIANTPILEIQSEVIPNHESQSQLFANQGSPALSNSRSNILSGKAPVEFESFNREPPFNPFLKQRIEVDSSHQLTDSRLLKNEPSVCFSNTKSHTQSYSRLSGSQVSMRFSNIERPSQKINPFRRSSVTPIIETSMCSNYLGSSPGKENLCPNIFMGENIKSEEKCFLRSRLFKNTEPKLTNTHSESTAERAPSSQSQFDEDECLY